MLLLPKDSRVDFTKRYPRTTSPTCSIRLIEYLQEQRQTLIVIKKEILFRVREVQDIERHLAIYVQV